MMDFLVTNWGLTLIVALIVAGLINLIKNDKVKAKKWLLLAVLEAEKEFGSRTGQVKLRYVYKLFLSTFPLLSKVITFEQFSSMVDEVLEEMKHLIDTNIAVSDYVGVTEEK